MIPQSRRVVPPTPADKELLKEYSEVVQRNFGQLFDAAPDIKIGSAAPSVLEGGILSKRLVKIGSTWYEYTKVDATTWVRVALS